MTHPEPPLAGDETATLLGSLERVRAFVEWKCGGLDAARLQVKIAASSITLGGLLKHLALVEDDYATSRLFGRKIGPPWNAVDWDADPNWEWRTAADEARRSSDARPSGGRGIATLADALTPLTTLLRR